MQTIGTNGMVGVEPVEYKGVEKVVKSAFVQVAQKTKMKGLRVIFGNTQGIFAGDTVWVKEASIQTLSKSVFDVGGTSVMLCGLQDIVFVTPAEH